ncbi:MAG: folate family ECF transporter S component [Clostridia bacterium]|nr:folate family ECF transporter S component [Clostridia bacterium]
MGKRKDYLIKISLVAVLAALGFVLDRFLSVNTQAIKINLAFVPAAFAAILIGPAAGAAVWAIADLAGAILLPFGPYHPGFTVCAALMGAIYGLFLNSDPVNIDIKVKTRRFTLSVKNRKIRRFPNVIIPVLINCVIIGLFINTAWVSMLYGKYTYWGWFTVRLLEYAILVPVQIAVIPVLSDLSERIKKQLGF